MVFKYIEKLLILVPAGTRCVSVFALASWIGIPIGIGSATVAKRVCAIAAINEKSKSVIKKKVEKHDKIILLLRTKFNTIEILVSKALIDPQISHEEYVSVHGLLKE